ncbi:MAG: transglutaminase domain-containing protein [Haloplanus sp.]
MSDSERGGDADADAAQSVDSDGIGAEYGEVAIAVAAVVALIVAAALLPAAGVGGGGGGNGGSGAAAGTPETTATGTPGSTATGTPGTTATETSRRARTPGSVPGGTTRGSGSPSGVPLSTPPERMRIGSTRSTPVAPLARTPQFVVEAPRNAYWRQTAYGRYTGSAWESSRRWQPMAEGVPNDDLTADGRRMTYSVTLLRPSASLPTAWQPERVRVPNASAGVEASTVGGVRTTRPLPEGTTYRVRSAAPPTTPERLRSAGTDYPPRIERRYTQLPDATPARVGAFTADLTADDPTPYDAAVTVRDWLQRKPYSLNASHEPGEPIADQFIFEMDSGYCQYYATSMVVMLRTQGIPARYVVGYAPGKPVGENRYLVTADRGHAWVEVYFPDVGWVRFDPTGSGSPPVRNPRPPYDISLNRSAVAGAHVAITVAKNDTAVVGAPVSVNGERVGWTDAAGRVTTTLPYAAEITVTARPPGAATKFDRATNASATTRRLGPGDGRGGGVAAGLPPTDRSRPGPVRAYDLRASPIRFDHGGAGANHSSQRYRSATNATLSVDGTPVAGGGITVSASIRDVPVRGATVTLDGRQVGETTADGTLRLSLRNVSPGTHRLRVRRGAVDATATIEVRPRPDDPPERSRPSLTVSVTAPLGLPLPGGPATVRTTHNGTPVGDAAVRVGGVRAGETTNGTLGVTLPVRGTVAVVATGPNGATARTTVTGLYRNAGLVGAGVLALLAAVGWWLRRRGVTVRGAYRTLVATLTSLGEHAVAACLRAAELLVRLSRAIRRGLSTLAGLPGRLATRGLAAFGVLDPRRFLARLWRWLRGRAGGIGASGRTAGASRSGRTAANDGDDEAAATLRALWREFVALVAPPRVRTRTPGEIARYAVDRGLPAEPVRVVTEAYRDAEYGGFAPDDDRLVRVRAALRALRGESADAGDTGDDATGGEGP